MEDEKITMDKAKQIIGFVGGSLGALLLFLKSVGIEFGWFNQGSIDAFIVWLSSLVPLAFIAYGIWKNQYLFSKKAIEQEKVLKKEGLK